MSRLDALVADLLAKPEDEGRARALYAALAGTELCLFLAEEAAGDSLAPKLVPLESGPVALAFDSEERLTDFAGPAPFAALSGRSLAELLAPNDIGLGLNLGSVGEYVLTPEVLAWIAEHQVDAAASASQPVALHPPGSLAEALLPEIEARLAATQGLAQQAVLARAEYPHGVFRPLIGFIAAREGAEAGLSTLIGEALAIAGHDPAGCDIAFLPPDGPLTTRARAAGLVIDLPQPPARPAPDPTKPPRLR